MISNILINNYQSHKKSVLELSPGVNIISGESDNGKTAVLRALNWCLFNKPSKGDPSWNSDCSFVTVVFADNHKIMRCRDKENYYSIKDLSAPLKAIGQAVPTEVAQIVNITDINIHRQLDPPFLISNTAGEVAKTLNRVVNLDIIDNVLAHANKRIKDEKTQLCFAETSKKKYEEELTDLDWIDGAEEELKKIEELEKELGIITEDSELLCVLTDEIKIINVYLKETYEVLQFENEVDSLIEKENEVIKFDAESLQLTKVIHDIITSEGKIRLLDKLISQEQIVKNLINKNEELKKIKDEKMNLSFLIDNIENLNENLEAANESYNMNVAQFNRLMPDVCPLCGK
jgi:exonuclease SbcC